MGLSLLCLCLPYHWMGVIELVLQNRTNRAPSPSKSLPAFKIVVDERAGRVPWCSIPILHCSCDESSCGMLLCGSTGSKGRGYICPGSITGDAVDAALQLMTLWVIGLSAIAAGTHPWKG